MIAETLIQEWQSHFNENPHQTLPEYQIDWTTIRNNAEGVGISVGIGTVRKYLAIFRNTKIQIIPQNQPVLSTQLETILGIKTNVDELKTAIEQHLAEVTSIQSTLEDAIAIAQDNDTFARLIANNIQLEKEAVRLRQQATLADDNAKAERELRIQQGQTHSSSTR